MTLPAFSPERTAAVAAGRVRLAALAGQRKTIDVSALADFGIVSAPGEWASVCLGRGAFNSSGEQVTLTPQTSVLVGQGRLRLATVNGYLDQWAVYGDLPSLLVTDLSGDGRIWHLDGLHRLLAARLVNATLAADIAR